MFLFQLLVMRLRVIESFSVLGTEFRRQCGKAVVRDALPHLIGRFQIIGCFVVVVKVSVDKKLAQCISVTKAHGENLLDKFREYFPTVMSKGNMEHLEFLHLSIVE
jgi:hypothetical protein